MSNPFPLPYVEHECRKLGMTLDQYLSEVVAAYIEAIYFTEQEGEDLPPMDDQSVRLIEAECYAFLHLARWHVIDWLPSQIGHDFWLTRNGHGSGFWDRDCGTPASRDALTLLAQRFDIQDWYVGDNAILHAS